MLYWRSPHLSPKRIDALLTRPEEGLINDLVKSFALSLGDRDSDKLNQYCADAHTPRVLGSKKPPAAPLRDLTDRFHIRVHIVRAGAERVGSPPMRFPGSDIKPAGA
jgi:hypothetical protein